MNNISILILAAGSASRMGRPKQLLPLGDSTLLEKVIESAKNSEASNSYCVIGANANLISSEINVEAIEFIENPEWKMGLSSSIKVGVKYLQELKNPPDAILIVLADQPKITTKHINQLISEGGANKQTIVAANYDGKNGVPALFPSVFYTELLALEGDKGASHLLNSEVNKIISIPFQNALLDIDTMEDYKALLKSQSL